MNRLKELREEAMMTVRELSERSGVSEDTITKIENGHRKGRGVTLRKLAKALKVEPRLFSPQQFERTTVTGERAPEPLSKHDSGSEMPGVDPLVIDVQDADTLEAAISRAYKVMNTIEQPAGKAPPQERYPDGVLRMTISERQQNVLLTVLERGEVDPSTVAEMLEISVSTAHRDLSVLEEHGLVMIGKSGKQSLSMLGRDLAEAILTARIKGSESPQSWGFAEASDNDKSAKSGLYFDEALDRIAALMKVYESVAKFDPYRASIEEATAFFGLQERIVHVVRRIATAADHSPPALRILTDASIPATFAYHAFSPEDFPEWVRNMLSERMANPPSREDIQADIEGMSEGNVLEALDTVLSVSQSPGYSFRDDEHVYKGFLWSLQRGSSRYPARQVVQHSPEDHA